MPDTRAQLDAAIESAWSELDSFLAAIAEGTATAHDSNGWTVKDHVTHMAIWGDSAAVLFRGGSRHQALGITEDFYSKASFDEINDVIRRREADLPLDQAVQQLRETHSQLLAAVESLSDIDLDRTVRDVFPLAPRSDNRRVVDFIYENTAAHYSEHLPWMRRLVQ
ncbi:MAG: ClbS/DfsB family four-helix bundle protein [bacterium]